QEKGKQCAFWPDSTANTYDKLNVRKGNYPIWGPLHFLVNIDAMMKVVDKNAANIIGYFGGTVDPPAGVDLIKREGAGSVIPQCAMSVQRDSELGPLKPYKADKPCNCAWENSATGATSCKACPMGNECGSTETCSFGYCEAK